MDCGGSRLRSATESKVIWKSDACAHRGRCTHGSTTRSVAGGLSGEKRSVTDHGDTELPARSSAWRPLLLTSAALILVNALHGADHLRQGLGRLTGEVVVGGQGLLLLALIPFALAFLRHRTAPLAAVLVGAWTALAVSASHLAPHWSAFSDPYRDNDLDALSWALMLSVIATAAALAAVGIAAARHRRRRAACG